MEVILSQQVAGLGKRGDQVEVSAGYGRHYLFPRGLAVVANEGNRRAWAERVKQIERKEGKLLSEAEALQDVLSGKTVELPVKVNNRGAVFGSVTPLQIARALRKGGFNVAKEFIAIEGTIKEEGEHTIRITPHTQVNFSIVLKVLPETA